jgi:transposase
MARKTYSEEFRRDAVELYRVTGGATISKIAGDLGITDATLSRWVKAAGVRVRGRHSPPPSLAPLDEVARLRARVVELEATERTLATKRDILRRRNISPARGTGEPLPVRRRPPGHLRGKRLCTTVQVGRSAF